MRSSPICRDAALCNIARGLQRVAFAMMSGTPSPSKAVQETTAASSLQQEISPMELSTTAKAALSKSQVPQAVEYRRIPATRVHRASGFASLFFQLGMEKLRGGGEADGGLLSTAGHQRIVDTLCRMRGAVLKLGQMLSIQDEKTVPPHVSALFQRVRDHAFAMPPSQLRATLATEWGTESWQNDLFLAFDECPVGAASIGQVHRGMLKPGVGGTDPRGEPVEVAVKVQYPGVAKSIDADVANLKLLMSLHILPPGMFVDKILAELRTELSGECQYKLEASKQMRYRSLVGQDADLSKLFYVPRVFPSLSTDQVLVSEFVRGVTIDSLAAHQDVPQALRNHVATQFMRLTLTELFEWRFMQTDPNYSNYLFNAEQQKVYLLDFGASREYAEDFIADYLDVVAAAAMGDRAKIIEKSIALGFLTGREVPEMVDAHCASVLLLGKPFRDRTTPFDFSATNLPSLIQQHVPTMVRLRLRPPPTPIYSLHRRLSGTILLATKYKATIDSGRIFWEIYDAVQAKRSAIAPSKLAETS